MSSQKKHVSFDEMHNEIQEYEPVSPQNKSKFWMSRSQIRDNKAKANEEMMMQKTRELVKAKLVDETVLDDSDPEILTKQVKILQDRLEKIMSSPKEEILAFLKTKYNWITDCNDNWKDLPANIQKAASDLGYTEELWDEFNNQLEIFSTSWQELTPIQRDAANRLGFNEISWFGSLENPLSKLPAEAEATLVEEDDNEEEKETESMYDWSDQDDSSDGSTEDVTTEVWTQKSSEETANVPSMEIDTEYAWGEKSDDESSTSSTSSIEEDDRDIDEDEFMANFLPDEQTHENKTPQQRYVQINDELAHDESDGEEKCDARAKALPAVHDVKTYVDYNGNQAVYQQPEETSPLLGRYPDKDEGLHRRAMSENRDGRGLSLPFGSKGHDGETDQPAKPSSGASKRFSYAWLIPAVGLPLIWFAFYGIPKNRRMQA